MSAKKYRIWLVAIILVAFAVRLYNLTYHSLWFDEAVSVYWARQSIPRILEVGFTLVEDRLPPLYYLLLKGWTSLFGFSEWSVRGLPVLFGVLLVPVVATIAALLFNRRTAVMTAILVAFNPFLIWYSQETRMYAPAVFFGALAILAFLQVCVPKQGAGVRSQESEKQVHSSQFTTTVPETKWSGIHNLLFTILFILSAIAALYSHLYSGFLLVALGLWLVISYPRRWKLWGIFAVGGLIITLLYLPILLAIWRFSAESTPGNPLTGLLQRAWWLLQSFTLWKSSLTPMLATGVSMLTLLFALAAYLPHRHSQFTTIVPETKWRGIHNSQFIIKHPRLLVTLLLIIPFLIANVLLLRNHLAFFGERYFIVMTPWLLMLAALGADNVGSRVVGNRVTSSNAAGPRQETRNSEPETQNSPHATRNTQHTLRFTFYVLPFLILLLISFISLPSQWTPSAAKEAWRQSVTYLAQHATPTDGILIHPDWVRHPFQFYFRGPGQTYAAFSDVTPKTDLDGPMQGVISDHPVIWLIQSHTEAPDPDQRIDQWLAARYPLVTELYPPGISLKGYAPGYQLDTLPPDVQQVDLPFNNGMRLVGYQIDEVAAATDDLFHPPSGWVHVTLYWVANQPITTDAVPFVNLVGPEGVWGVSLERQNDALKLYPTSQWQVDGPLIRHDLDINLNPATPPGRYQIVVGIHGVESQQPLTEVEIR